MTCQRKTQNLCWIVIAFQYVGAMTVLILLAFRACNTFETVIGDGIRTQGGAEVTEPERAPLLLPKDDDTSSWGSSYDSISHDEEDLEEWLAGSSLEGQISKEGENNGNNPRRLCVICCDAPRDCFFLPCGHCAACFTCGARYVGITYPILYNNAGCIYLTGWSENIISSMQNIRGGRLLSHMPSKDEESEEDIHRLNGGF